MRSRVAVLLGAMAMLMPACGGGGQDPASLKEIARASSGAIDVVVLAAGNAIQNDKDTFTIEFRSQSSGQPVDVGDVIVSATMAMAGMAPMIGKVDVSKTSTPGRYTVTSALGMAGSWRLNVEWNGPQGAGSVALQTRAQ
jgi:hypothetical protein